MTNCDARPNISNPDIYSLERHSRKSSGFRCSHVVNPALPECDGSYCFRVEDNLTAVFRTLLFFTLLMVTLPLFLYFFTKVYVFEGMKHVIINIGLVYRPSIHVQGFIRGGVRGVRPPTQDLWGDIPPTNFQNTCKNR